MSKIYIYKMTSDDGGAPCVRNGVLTLAICKPGIRSVARQSDTILGFAGNELYADNCLVYAAEVTHHLDARKYFSESRYASRPDCIYSWDGRLFEWKKGSFFHGPSSLPHDLGDPPDYAKARVVLSAGPDKFRYFGEKCPVNYKRGGYPHLKELIERLMQGHRCNFGPSLLAELGRFKEEVFCVPFEYFETPESDGLCGHKCSGADSTVVEIDCRSL